MSWRHSLAVLCVLGVAAGIAQCFFRNEHGEKLIEVRQIAAEIPTFPGFDVLRSTEISKSTSAYVGSAYRSRAHYAEVRDFYTRELTERGWRVESDEPTYDWFRDYGGRKLTLRKGEFEFWLEYAGTLNADQPDGWNYGTSVSWR